ncbi:ankyrin repeat-containing domain protein [Lipomyces arxii]|uniref:ankyrin repeat-containing domain protein n=1 Tax=Lipomyces arxii TaxID=56418 RepID=UPI0034CE967F
MFHRKSKKEKAEKETAAAAASTAKSHPVPVKTTTPAHVPPPPPASRGASSASVRPVPAATSTAPTLPPSIPLSIPPPMSSAGASNTSLAPSSKYVASTPSTASSITSSQDAEGAKPSEILIEASRRNNIDLLQELLSITPSAGDLINTAVDALGNSALHIAALNGSYECLDMLLDIEGVEVDPKNRLEENTPLHCAVMYSEEEPEHAVAIVDMLLDAGSDPRIRNKLKDKPIDLVPTTNPELRRMLQGAEMAIMMSPRDQVVEGQNIEDSGSESD